MEGADFGLNHVEIIPMRPTDIRGVMDIDARSFACNWTSDAFHTELNNRAAAYIVAKLDTTVIGYAGMWVVSEEAHITTLAVMPEFRGKHIGERLLVACITEAKHRKAKRLNLEVRVSNIIARRLYAKHSFLEIGERQRYYTDNGENALILSLNLWIN